MVRQRSGGHKAGEGSRAIAISQDSHAEHGNLIQPCLTQHVVALPSALVTFNPSLSCVSMHLCKWLYNDNNAACAPRVRCIRAHGCSCSICTATDT